MIQFIEWWQDLQRHLPAYQRDELPPPGVFFSMVIGCGVIWPLMLAKRLYKRQPLIGYYSQKKLGNL